MAELTEQQKKRIKIAQISAPIGGAAIGFLLGGGFVGESTTKKVVGVLIGITIGFGLAYLGKKKIEKE